MKKLIASAIAACLATPHAAAAQEDEAMHFVPNTDWSLDYGEDYCRLLRGFAHGSDELTLVIDRIQPGPVARIMVSGTGLSTSRRARTIGFRFLSLEDARESMILRAPNAAGGDVYNLGEVYLAPIEDSRTREQQRSLRARYNRSAERAFANEVESLIFDTGVAETVVLETGPLGGAIEALQVCADELISHWGLDPERARNARRAAVPANDMTSWLPAGTIDRRQTALLLGGQNQARLMIDAEGVPTDCASHFASLPAATNQAICAALIENARFAPASDAGGTPMESYWIAQLTFLAQAQ